MVSFLRQVHAGFGTSGSGQGGSSRAFCHWLLATQPSGLAALETQPIASCIHFRLSLCSFTDRDAHLVSSIFVFDPLCLWASCTTSTPDVHSGSLRSPRGAETALEIRRHSDNGCIADDDSNTVISDFDQGKPINTKTTWTLLLYLTSEADGCRGGETVFFPNDRRVAKEEVAVAPETGMVLLHKHGNDCMLVSDPLPCGNLTAGLPAPPLHAAHPYHAVVILLITAQKSSMRVARSLPGRNGSFGAISASVNSCVQFVLEKKNYHPPYCLLIESVRPAAIPQPHVPPKNCRR